MKRPVIGGLCALILAIAPPPPPWSGAAQAAEAAAPSPRAVDHARRYLKAIRMEETIQMVMDALGPMMLEAEAARRPGLTDREKQALLDSTTESMVAVMPRFTELYAVELASIYTEEELLALAEFYESRLGRSITTKTRAASEAGERAMMKLLPELTEEMLRRLCGRIDCESSTAERITS